MAFKLHCKLQCPQKLAQSTCPRLVGKDCGFLGDVSTRGKRHVFPIHRGRCFKISQVCRHSTAGIAISIGTCKSISEKHYLSMVWYMELAVPRPRCLRNHLRGQRCSQAAQAFAWQVRGSEFNPWSKKKKSFEQLHLGAYDYISLI